MKQTAFFCQLPENVVTKDVFVVKEKLNGSTVVSVTFRQTVLFSCTDLLKFENTFYYGND